MVLAVREDSPLLEKSRRDEGYPFPVVSPELLKGMRLRLALESR